MRKILSLILVLSMVMSFAFASSFTDTNEITHTEAVEVLTALEVIEGYPDGSFNPKGEVTRAEMAKMVAVIANEGEDVNALYKNACTFADSTNHWAAGYIAYCANEGIISGKSSVMFDPEGKVTGVEAAKMLLCALGYNADTEGFKGTNWASAVLGKAASAGLVGKNYNLVVDMSAPLNREDTAQMMLNALNATMVEYENASTITIGNVVVNNNSTAKKVVNVNDHIKRDGYMQLGEAKFDALRLAEGDSDNFNRLGNSWSYKNGLIGTYAKEATIVYQNVVTGGKVYTDLGKIKVNQYDVTYYVDGTEDVGLENLFVNSVTSGNTTELGACGATLEIYLDEDVKTIRVVQINFYVGTIAQVWEAQYDANHDVSRDAYVKVSPMVAAHNNAEAAELDNGTTTVKATVQTNAFVSADKDTIIVYTYSTESNTIESVVKAQKISGTQSGYAVVNAEYIDVTIGGVTYPIAATFVDDNMFGAYGDTIVAYLDPYGNVIYTEAEAATSYAFVMAAGHSGQFINDNEYKARLLFTDGTIKIVDTKLDYSDLTNSIVSYALRSNGTYELHQVAGNYENGVNVTYRSGTVKINNGAVYGNNNTVFVVETVSNDESTYTVYTGLQSVPNIEGAGANYYGFGKYGEAATVVYFLGVNENDVNASTSTSNTVVFFATPNDSLRTTQNMQYYTVNAVVDGKVTTVNVEAGDRAYNHLTIGEPTVARRVSTNANGIITNVVNENNYLAEYEDFTMDNDNVYTGIYNKGVIEVKLGANTQSYSVTENTPVYTYNTTTKTMNATNIKAYYPTAVDYIIIAFDSSKEIGNTDIVALYIVEHN